MNLREFLETRERELLREIATLHEQVAPKEAELSEIRRAKAALGIGHHHLVTSVSAMPLSMEVHSTATATLPAVSQSPYERLTMKELVVKALREHLHHGATTRELLDFFRDAWGRNIERTNLSPQVSRLFQDGTIRRQGTRWVLTELLAEHIHQMDEKLDQTNNDNE
jgi:hypothetical protein